jgi:hypothetical protein
MESAVNPRITQTFLTASQISHQDGILDKTRALSSFFETPFFCATMPIYPPTFTKWPFCGRGFVIDNYKRIYVFCQANM